MIRAIRGFNGLVPDEARLRTDPDPSQCVQVEVDDPSCRVPRCEGMFRGDAEGGWRHEVTFLAEVHVGGCLLISELGSKYLERQDSFSNGLQVPGDDV